MNSKRFAQVIISISNTQIDKAFTYKIPENMAVSAGIRVIVPFGKGNKEVVGFVISLNQDVQMDCAKYKSIIRSIDQTPVLTSELLELAKWMREKYYTTYAKCIQTVLPAGIQSKSTLSKSIRVASIISDDEAASLMLTYLSSERTYSQGQVLEFLRENDKAAVSDIKEALSVSDSPIRTLVKKGVIQIETIIRKGQDPFTSDDSSQAPPTVTLNDEQRAALLGLSQLMKKREAASALLHGVTGSGKTEIYIRLIEQALKDGRQAIMLVPEISLTPQTVNRFIHRFSGKVAVTHSKMSLRERYEQWKKAFDGEVSVMIGPRSAIFAPFENIGVIVVDEEHDHSYQSDNTPKYDAKAVAAQRIQSHQGLLVLGTATPNVETYYKVREHGLHLFPLKKRAGSDAMPDIHTVDMRLELANGNKSIFSEQLKEAIACNLDNKEQTILFLNRRGYANFVSCRMCGYVLSCEDCNVAYTYHSKGNKLTCHYCGRTITNVTTCPQCQSIFIKQFGVGTQKVEEEVHKLFPEAHTLRMDLDTTSKKHGHETILAQFRNEQADILIGTQMVAKGHDFPKVTLVGIVAADVSLNAGDFRSAETTYQLITQVAGRAGRADLPGRVFIQTYNSEHYAITYAQNQDFEGFYENEIVLRKSMNYPPFTHIFVVMLFGEDEKRIIQCCHHLLRIMHFFNEKAQGRFEMIGPAPAQISKVKRQYRWKIIVKSADENRLRNFVLYCMDQLKKSEAMAGVLCNLSLNPTVVL